MNMTTEDECDDMEYDGNDRAQFLHEIQPYNKEEDYFQIAKSYGLMVVLGTVWSADQKPHSNEDDLTQKIQSFANATGFQLKSGTTGGTTRVHTCKSSPDCPFLITTNVSKSNGIARLSRRLYCFRHNHPLPNTTMQFTWNTTIDTSIPTKRPLDSGTNENNSQLTLEITRPPIYSKTEYLAAVRALGFCKRIGPMSVQPVLKSFDSKEDALSRLYFLAVKVGFQIKHKVGTMQYSCKSVDGCPFNITLNIRSTGEVKLSQRLCHFEHDHEYGVLDKPAEGKNTTMNSAIIAHSIAASGMDWAKASHMDFRNHCIATFGVPIGPTRSTTVRQELAAPDIEKHAKKYREMDKAVNDAIAQVRAFEAENPLLPDIEDIHSMRREMYHRWDIERRRMALDEMKHAREEEEAKMHHRINLAKLHQAEVELKLAKVKAKQELVAVGLNLLEAETAISS